LDIFFFLSVENHRKKDDEVVAERSLWVWGKKFQRAFYDLDGAYFEYHYSISLVMMMCNIIKKKSLVSRNRKKALRKRKSLDDVCAHMYNNRIMASGNFHFFTLIWWTLGRKK
jgi:hypothetical protein